MFSSVHSSSLLNCLCTGNWIISLYPYYYFSFTFSFQVVVVVVVCKTKRRRGRRFFVLCEGKDDNCNHVNHLYIRQISNLLTIFHIFHIFLYLFRVLVGNKLDDVDERNDNPPSITNCINLQHRLCWRTYLCLIGKPV